MCWQAAIPLILSAGGAIAQKKAQDDLRDDQARVAAEGILRQAALNRDASARVAQTTQELAASNPDAERAAKRATYTDALRRSMGTRAGATPVSGAVSSRFTEDADAAANETEAEAANLADLTAAIEAPTYQRMNEGVAVNNAGVDLSLLRGRSAGQDYLTRLRMAMQKPNEWLQAGGQLMSGAGAALAGGGGMDFGGGNPFDDGTASSGLTANQRRMTWKGDKPVKVNPNRGRP